MNPHTAIPTSAATPAPATIVAPRDSRSPGRSTRSSVPSAPSHASAKRAAGTAPSKINRGSASDTPRNRNVPSPFAPIAAAIVAIPTAATVAIRIPPRMTGAASGSSTSHSRCPPVIPIPTAASRTPRSIPCSPSTVVFNIGNSEYTTSAARAGGFPIVPRNTMSKNPSNARLGTVCKILATPSAARSNLADRDAATPSGTAINTASNSASTTRSRCAAVASSTATR